MISSGSSIAQPLNPVASAHTQGVTWPSARGPGHSASSIPRLGTGVIQLHSHGAGWASLSSRVLSCSSTGWSRKKKDALRINFRVVCDHSPPPHPPRNIDALRRHIKGRGNTREPRWREGRGPDDRLCFLSDLTGQGQSQPIERPSRISRRIGTLCDVHFVARNPRLASRGVQEEVRL